ncbi:D-alanyl-D-alanine carboxypeptidase [Fulvivirga sediminis]|uniref:D-alanyl-D-alanine carboxypeptidase n=1 Tax=Fulvivirga sediminis TaxID=2803949 RepID=A0A937F8U6_9BACT|nr:D-alanyl-D-alanine carboxypeptidase [Fulvivirga sediminis]MBL3657830.1 D-alanyl-D-alanine carboxypeptidase [Fulvivirga sediminis]
MNDIARFIYWGILLCFFSCASINKKEITRELISVEKEFHNHTGFVLYDPEEDKTLISYQGNQYFTPASNTKIPTLYLSMHILPDSIPGIYYVEKGDSLIFWGTGDPSFLNDRLPQSQIYEFLKKSDKKLFFSGDNFYDHHFGSGWAWDDYLYTFSSEKSPFTIYGNNIKVKKSRSQSFLEVEQAYFKRYFWLGDSANISEQVVRDYNSNSFVYHPPLASKTINDEIPFKYSDYLLTQALADTLNKQVGLLEMPLPLHYETKYSILADSAYRVMMQQSDNFIAEQLLLTCAGILTDSLKAENGLMYGQRELFKNIPDSLVWVDGSGLSRYNLFTPAALVWIWTQLYKEVPHERLYSLLPAGGQPGTLRRYYQSDEPYLFGKTGTLSNNHNLSGFLKTKKGKIYVFAFMNNNYPEKSGPVKRRMEKILQEIYLNN